MMDTSYPDAIIALEKAVDRACDVARDMLTRAEIAKELRRIADGWEE